MTDDKQADAVYTMEDSELGGHCTHTVSLKQLRKWAGDICKQFRLPTPSVVIRDLGIYDGECRYESACILLHPKRGRNGLVLAHELAHYVVSRLHPRAAVHGPTWVMYYAKFLDQLRLVPEAGVRAIARQHKVCVRSAAPGRID